VSYLVCSGKVAIWPMPPAVFTHCQQHLDMVNGAVSPINLVFHHLLHITDHLPGPIHPQQPIQKVDKVCNIVFLSFLLTFCGLTGFKHDKQHTAATTALSPHSRDVRCAGHNRGATDDRGDPTKGIATRCAVHMPPPCSH
jgi:hypothetical protein